MNTPIPCPDGIITPEIFRQMLMQYTKTGRVALWVPVDEIDHPDLDEDQYHWVTYLVDKNLLDVCECEQECNHGEEN